MMTFGTLLLKPMPLLLMMKMMTMKKKMLTERQRF